MNLRGTRKLVTSAPDRKFYAKTRAFGRFGMRVFVPQVMDRPHWHGHIEANFVKNCRMHYVLDGENIIIEPDQFVIFWAGVSHQLTRVEPIGEQTPELCNIYLPLDAFLLMPYVPNLQVALLTGGMVAVGSNLCSPQQLQRWYADYRSNQPERIDVVKMEMHALFRRISLEPFEYLQQPWKIKRLKSNIASEHVRHVVAMVQHVLDHVSEPLSNSDVTRVTGLHTNYALSLFSKTMLLPLKQFIIRMRLLRARGMLLESDVPVSQISLDCGFGSSSQFYAHFATAYGIPPKQLRDRLIG